jgi:O-antigen/teichoic acid export membrane protein
VSILDVMKLDLETVMIFWRQNLGKGLAFLALPLGNVILFDFTNIILGSVISKEFVAELSLIRISTGVIRQFSSAILTSYSPVLSQAIFSANAHVIRRLQNRIRFTLLVAISMISGLLLISSNLIFEHYFKETTLLSRPIFVLFAVSVVLDIPWNYRSTFLFAANLHQGIAKRFLLSSLLAIISVFFLAPAMGFYE